MAKKTQKPQSHAEHAAEPGYEKHDVNLKMLTAAALGIVVFLVVSIIALNEAYLLSSEHRYAERVLKPQSAALRDLQARDTEILNGYRRVDAAKGVYAIPIERAMELMARETFQQKVQSLNGGAAQ